MDLINYYTKEKNIIQCVHCNGSGICAHSELQVKYNSDNYLLGWAQCCHTCGQGLIHAGVETGTWWKPKRILNTTPKPPLCKICGGKGFTAII